MEMEAIQRSDMRLKLYSYTRAVQRKFGVVHTVLNRPRREGTCEKSSWVKQRRRVVVNAKDSINSLYREKQHWSHAKSMRDQLWTDTVACLEKSVA